MQNLRVGDSIVVIKTSLGKDGKSTCVRQGDQYTIMEIFLKDGKVKFKTVESCSKDGQVCPCKPEDRCDVTGWMLMGGDFNVDLWFVKVNKPSFTDSELRTAVSLPSIEETKKVMGL